MRRQCPPLFPFEGDEILHGGIECWFVQLFWWPLKWFLGEWRVE